jgi:hypothetical protein
VRPAQCVLRPFVEPAAASPVALCDDDGWAALSATTGAHGPRGATGATGDGGDGGSIPFAKATADGEPLPLVSFRSHTALYRVSTALPRHTRRPTSTSPSPRPPCDSRLRNQNVADAGPLLPLRERSPRVPATLGTTRQGRPRACVHRISATARHGILTHSIQYPRRCSLLAARCRLPAAGC